MRLLIGLFFLLATAECFCQTAPPQQDFVESQLKIPPMNDSNSEFEIRLVADVRTTTRDKFVWIKKERGQWHAQSFVYTSAYTNGMFKLDKRREEKIDRNWDILVRKLFIGNWFDTPDQP